MYIHDANGAIVYYEGYWLVCPFPHLNNALHSVPLFLSGNNELSTGENKYLSETMRLDWYQTPHFIYFVVNDPLVQKGSFAEITTVWLMRYDDAVKWFSNLGYTLVTDIAARRRK